MKLTWMGTAALLLEQGETKIALDPFMGIPPREEDHMLKAFRQVSHVLVTHGHFDHIEQIPYIYKDGKCTIHCTAAPMATLKREGVAEDALSLIRPGDSIDIPPFHIEVFHSEHCRFDRPLIMRKLHSRAVLRHPLKLIKMLRKNKPYPENGEIVFYDIHCGGSHLQIMGSMGLDENVDYPTGADVLVFPLQGRSDQDTFGLTLVERLRPKCILLDHYDNAFPPMTDDVDTSGFVKNVMDRFGIPVKPLRMFETIDL